MLRLNFTVYNDDGDEIEMSVPARYVICGSCDGKGTSSAYLGAYTAEEMNEQGPEFLEDYVNGVYDRPCDKCGGSGKVLVENRNACVSAKDKAALAALDGMRAEEAEYNAIVAMERRCGA